MGHSKRARSIVGHKNFSGSGGIKATNQEKLNEFTNKISNKDQAQISEYAVKYLLIALPNGSSKIVIYYCLKYGIQFLKDSQEDGVEYATKNLAGTIIKQHVVGEVIDSAWDHVEDHVIQENANKGLSRFAEEAFKETMSEIITKGVDAL
ncbi:MAG: hypothetical protein Q7R52_03330 [archaeon]|nr:hypothetical protein [archaeon]